MTRAAATQALDAADELLAWLDRQPSRSLPMAREKLEQSHPEEPRQEAGLLQEIESAPAASDRAAAGQGRESFSAGLPLAETDWLFHRLTISGPREDLQWFRGAAAGAGIIPWQYDLDRMEEDYFHMLVSPKPPQQRSLSVAGARIFARRLRDAVGHRHDLAASRVGRSRACPLDLHALLPVPHAMLAMGPDAPETLAWLSRHWGTTQPLRHAVQEPPAGRGQNQANGVGPVLLSFWSADWTPWAAFKQLGHTWPMLRLDCRPIYELP